MIYSNVLAEKQTSSSSFNYLEESNKIANLDLRKYSAKSYNIGVQANKCSSEELVSKVLRKCVIKKQGIHPRIFCRRWFGLEKIKANGQPRYREEQILAMESEHGYREKCINLMARLLKIKPNTIHRWGKGVEFDKISPDKLTQYEIYLGYIDTIRVMATSFAELDQESLIQFSHNLSV